MQNNEDKDLVAGIARVLGADAVAPNNSLLSDKPKEHDKCLVCGRKLRGRKARIRGMGKACEKKAAAKQTISIDEAVLWNELFTIHEANKNKPIEEQVNFMKLYKIEKR
jgi:hypothetical protein